jgi:hypothetical protein
MGDSARAQSKRQDGFPGSVDFEITKEASRFLRLVEVDPDDFYKVQTIQGSSFFNDSLIAWLCKQMLCKTD